MKKPTPLSAIIVPAPLPESLYSTQILKSTYSFRGLKVLLGAADYSKAGDRNAGLAAPDEITREAARTILAGLTLQEIYHNPLTDDKGDVDSVMRVSYDIDREQFAKISSLTLGQVKDTLLEASGKEIQAIGAALTAVMAAALAKLLDTHELILVARKIKCVTRARTTLGLSGTLSSRLQPNHPTDDLRGITLLTYLGLSMGGGDALIGVNPAVDTVANISSILHHLSQLRCNCKVPTQICVLSHMKTQLACLNQGAPVEIMFQSLAGTERTLTEEFDVTVDLLDHAYNTMCSRSILRKQAKNFMYFETGQGSEFSYGKHNGIDMTTTEALCYTLARRYQPFMVNNVTGFIGPETHLDNFEMIISNLQDHFMGKLLGLPMGMAPCYTLHSRITLEGQQMASELLAAAGANYYMDVYGNTDRMLAYFDTSGHDDQTLREIHNRQTTPEFLKWAIQHKIFVRKGKKIRRGPNWGNPRIFCSSDLELQELKEATPAVYGFENAGPRLADRVSRQFKANQAVGREAIYMELDFAQLNGISMRILQTNAESKEEHLNSPHLGTALSEASLAQLTQEHNEVQIVITDGLSAPAVHYNIPELYPILVDGLTTKNIRMGRPIATRYGRVKLAEPIAAGLQCDLVILLIGERPGGDALASTSLSAYLAYYLKNEEVRQKAARFSGNPDIRFEYTVISNIYRGGLPPMEAASVIVEKTLQILEHQAAGNRLENIVNQIQQ